VSIFDHDNNPYVPADTDVIRFALKKTFADAEPLIVKQIPVKTMELRLESEDTKQLEVGAYVYDIEITMGDGIVDTFIDRQKFIVTDEVH
jgi:uncharacterized membrane protein YkoI